MTELTAFRLEALLLLLVAFLLGLFLGRLIKWWLCKSRREIVATGGIDAPDMKGGNISGKAALGAVGLAAAGTAAAGIASAFHRSMHSPGVPPLRSEAHPKHGGGRSVAFSLSRSDRSGVDGGSVGSGSDDGLSDTNGGGRWLPRVTTSGPPRGIT